MQDIWSLAIAEIVVIAKEKEEENSEKMKRLMRMDIVESLKLLDEKGDYKLLCGDLVEGVEEKRGKQSEGGGGWGGVACV